MSTIQERLRASAIKLGYRTSEYVDGQPVSPCDGEALDAAQEMGEAANVIDGLVEALQMAENAVNASYAQANAEWQGHQSEEDRCDNAIREWREKRDCALASLKGGAAS